MFIVGSGAGKALNPLVNELDKWSLQASESANSNPSLIIKEHSYPVIHVDDWLPVTAIDPDMKDGPWIAGGAALAWFKKTSVGIHKDIDVFCRDEEQAKKTINRVMKVFNVSKHNIFESDNATTIPVAKGELNWKIQVITCRYFKSIHDVISSFDISVCQVATTGYEWILGDNTAKDIRQNNLRFNTITSQSIKRLVKYWTYGYIPVEGTLEKIQQSDAACLNDFSSDQEYSNAF